MDKKYITLIENGFYKDVFLLTDEEIGNFELEQGQELIDIPKPSGTAALIKPKWDNEKWIEAATPEEIEEANYVMPPTQTEEQQRISDLEAAMAAVLGGVI